MKTQTMIMAGILLLLVACAEQTAQQRYDDASSQPTIVELEETAPADQAAAQRARADAYRQFNRVQPKSEVMLASPALRRPGIVNDYAYYPPHHQDRENYHQRSDNPIKRVSEQPVSTFSVDVDTAGYSNVRRMLSKEGRLPPQDAVKAEEMINYFSYNYALPTSPAQPFTVNTAIAPAPWNEHRHLLQIGLKGFAPNQRQRPDANLVFLVDVSGSMRSPDKLGLVKKSLTLLVNNMQSRDTIALAVYAGAAGVVLEPTAGDQKAKIRSAIDALEAGGSTNGGAGIELAYSLAQQRFIDGGINRVIIASDGDMNVGTVSIEALKTWSSASAKAELH